MKTIEVVFHSKHVDNPKTQQVKFTQIPNVGEEVYFGDSRYVVKYRAWDVIDGELVCTSIILE